MKNILVSLVLIVLAGCAILYLNERLFQKGAPVSYLTYSDLQKLASGTAIGKRLSYKLQKQLTTPYLLNRFRAVIHPAPTQNFVRLAHWNIERGFNIDEIKGIFISPDSYFYNFRKNIKDGLYDNFKNELKTLSHSEIILLNEVDIGMPRTNYKNVVRELADTLGYNFAFATEFIELNPILSGQKIDPDKYLGLHGNAIISKYPIQKAWIIRLPEVYKWYASEIKQQSPLEYGRRFGANEVFKVQITSEVRRGSRNALVAQIRLPSKELITIIATHLEDRCYPQGRLKQIEYVLEKLKYINTPLVLAGDFNTTTTDSIPTSVTKEFVKRIKDPHFIARQAILAFLAPGIPLVTNLSAAVISKAFQFKDPAVPSIPVLFPNQERGLFNYLREFKFSDGEGFDFSGDRERSSNGKGGLLSNSNERQLKGFESTFRFVQPMGVAYFKLDWFFVKPKGSRFKPFNGQTLKLINEAFPERVSDHNPLTVDLTL